MTKILTLLTGKIPAETLKKIVFAHLGAKRTEVVLGPSLGADGALVKVGDKLLVSSMDPITGATERIGLLAVNVNANDVATFGVLPSFLSSCILLPEDSTEKTVKSISEQIDESAKRLGIAIIGGHTEVSPELHRPIVIGCAMGITEPGRYVTSSGSKPGDHIILTKGAGIEGTAVLATECRSQIERNMNKTLLSSAEKFYEQISVVEEAILAFNKGGVTAMHDPTEGGVVGGIHELADAANLGVKISEKNIFVSKETESICRFFQIDPLQLISSGALLISANPASSKAIIKELNGHGIKASVIGEFIEKPSERLLIKKDQSAIDLPRPASDHLWFALKKLNEISQ